LRFDPLDYIWNANLRGFSVCYLSCSTHWFALLHRRDKVALETTCIKNVKFKIIKIRTGFQLIGYFYYSENLNWATCGPRVGHSWIIKCFHQRVVWFKP